MKKHITLTFQEYLSEQIEIPNILYHATFKPLLKKIKREGVGGKSLKKIWSDSKSGVVYLAKEPEVAFSYAETAFTENEELPESWENEIIVLAIDANKLDKNKLFIDSNVIDNEGDTLEYSGIIPWKYIIDVIKY